MLQTLFGLPAIVRRTKVKQLERCLALARCLLLFLLCTEYCWRGCLFFCGSCIRLRRGWCKRDIEPNWSTVIEQHASFALFLGQRLQFVHLSGKECLAFAPQVLGLACFKCTHLVIRSFLRGEATDSLSTPAYAVGVEELVRLVVIPDVKPRTHLCTITFFGFTCSTVAGDGTLKSLNAITLAGLVTAFALEKTKTSETGFNMNSMQRTSLNELSSSRLLASFRSCSSSSSVFDALPGSWRSSSPSRLSALTKPTGFEKP